MTIEHDTTVDREVYDGLRAKVGPLRDTVTAAKAVLCADKSDYYRCILDASNLVYALLALPEQRPGSWEAPHVEALREPLCEVLDALKAERPSLDGADR